MTAFRRAHQCVREPQYKVMKKCVRCSKRLSGRQSEYCSRKCKNDNNNKLFQSCAAQQRRGRSRKLALINLHGNRCEMCSYDRNFSAPEFHHTEPKTKEFQLDLRSLSNRRWARILEEAKKCILVCSNCHKEIHNSGCTMALENSIPGCVAERPKKRNKKKTGKTRPFPDTSNNR